jgi:hypothetical protein
MNSSSIKSRGTIEVCMMWFNQPEFIPHNQHTKSTFTTYKLVPGKNASRATGKTNSRLMAHKAQKVLATNCLRRRRGKLRFCPLYNLYIRFLPFLRGRQVIQKHNPLVFE